MKKTKLTSFFLTVSSIILTSHSGFAEFDWGDYYDIEALPAPEGVDYQIGGLDFTAKGELIACFHRGEVMTYDEGTKEWKLFASGLHEPLGIYVEEEGTVLVIQRSELTRLHDKDGDGLADFYEMVSNDWGLTGNYHEFAFGLVKDSKKNIYISLGTASNGSGVREQIRGEWNEAGGLTHGDFLSGGKHGSWKEKKRGKPRMYARVPYRGCVLKIEPGSPKAHVYATGFRTPNGLYIDKDEQLWVSDNQGDWVGASKVFRVEEGEFHGHAASLLWAENPPNKVPSKLPITELEKRRVKAPGLFPQGDAGNSITQMVGLNESFAPLIQSDAPEQLIIGEMNHARIVRYMPDIVNGHHQGTAGHMVVSKALGTGTNRMIYTPDNKSMIIGKTHLSWPGQEGVYKVTYNGEPYLLVESVKLTPEGFEFTFNAPVEAALTPSDYTVESYRIAYHAKYGSKKFELEKEVCSEVSVEGHVLTIKLADKPKGNRMYDISLPKSLTSKLSDISSSRFWYMAHEVY